ncbi:MAG: hypothetical protein C4311_12120 [Chloroflexota bacterium]
MSARVEGRTTDLSPHSPPLIGEGQGEEFVRPPSLKASVLIVGYNESKLILDCIGSVLDQDLPRDEYEVIFVDNGSHDNSAELVQTHYPEVTVIRLMPNVGYPAGNNAGLKYVNGPRVVMLSADTVVPRTWLRELLGPMDADSQVKVCHAAMVIPGDPGYEEGLATRATPKAAAYHDMTRLGFIKPTWVATESDPVQTLHVAGASAALDLSILDEIGGYLLDGDYYLDCDEIDLGFRVNALGYKVLAVPRAAYYHRHPFNTQVNLKNIRTRARRLLRLQRNKFITFYKNLYLSEFLLYLPVVLFGGPFKIRAYASRFSGPQRILNMLGLAAFAWAGFLVAALGYFPRFAAKRRFILAHRRQPKGWFVRELWKRNP